MPKRSCRNTRTFTNNITIIFNNETGRDRLQSGAAYPMLAAFRWMVKENKKTGKYKWKGGFDSVLERWDEVKEELVKQTNDKSYEVNNNSNAIGKSRTHWSSLHQTVAFRDLIKMQGG